MKRTPSLTLSLTLLASTVAAHAEPIGEADMVFERLGPDPKFVVDA